MGKLPSLLIPSGGGQNAIFKGGGDINSGVYSAASGAVSGLACGPKTTWRLNFAGPLSKGNPTKVRAGQHCNACNWLAPATPGF